MASASSPVGAAAGSLAISPAAQTVGHGSPFTVTIVQNADVATSGAQADLSFNQALMQITSVEAGAAYAGGSLVAGVAPQTVAQAIAEANTTGTLQNVSAFYTPGGGSVPAGQADFVILHMQATAPGTNSPLTLSQAEMLDAAGEVVPVTTAGGQVTIGPPSAMTWGDVNCGGTVNAVDALTVLRANAGLPVSVPSGCPTIGSDVSGRMWGDVNCGGMVNAVDALTLLRANAGLSVTIPLGCPVIGTTYP
jgi:hypothetical protein